MQGKAFLILGCFLALSVLGPAAAAPQSTPAASAESLLKEGKAAEALPLLLDLHKSRPGDWQVCHLAGIAYTQLQQFGNARDYYRKALGGNPNFLPARKNLAVVLWFLGEHADSEREFASVAKAAPADPVPQLYLGLAAHRRDEFAEARRRFQSAGDLALANPEVLPAVVESFLGAGDLSVPHKLLQQLEAAERLDEQLAFRVGVAFARFDRNREAAVCFEKSLAAGARRPEVPIALGDIYDKLAEPEKALAAYRRAIEMDPGADDGYLALAQFSYLHQNNDYALKILDQGLGRKPGSARLLHQRGIVLALLGRHEEAEQALKDASGADSKWNAPLLALGVSQMERGLSAEAAASFRRAAAIAPGDFRPEYLFAMALRRSGDAASRDEILAALEKASKLKPGDARPHASLGQAYLEAGNTEQAAKELEAALSIDPENTTALFQLSRLYRDQGDRDLARQMVDRFEKAKAKQREEEGSLVEILKIVTEE